MAHKIHIYDYYMLCILYMYILYSIYTHTYIHMYSLLLANDEQSYYIHLLSVK